MLSIVDLARYKFSGKKSTDEMDAESPSLSQSSSHAPGSLSYGKIIYAVPKSDAPIQDGKSWATAYSGLQPALEDAQANPGAAIWLREGDYIPSEIYAPPNAQGIPVPGGASGLANDTHLATFNLPPDTSIYGGFRGDEKKRKRCRNVEKHPTKLSGANYYWHVVTIGNDVTGAGIRAFIEGVTFMDGNAMGPSNGSTIDVPSVYQHSNGGGLYAISDSSISVHKCTFHANRANSIGGGAWVHNCNLSMWKCKFTGDFGQQQAGGIAVYNTYESIPHTSLILECDLEDNSALLFGGAIVTEGTLPHPGTKVEIVKCGGRNNRAFEGGALVVDSVTTVVKCCQFEDNIAYVTGGAAAVTNVVNQLAISRQRTPPPVTHFQEVFVESSFRDNLCTASQQLHDAMFGGPAFSSIDFSIGGGAFTSYLDSLAMCDKCVFEGNVSWGDGGAILNGDAAAQNPLGYNVTLYDASTLGTNCEFRNNRAYGSGGAIASKPSDYVFTPPLVIPIGATVLNVSNSCFEGNRATGQGQDIYASRTTGSLVCNKYEHPGTIYITPDSVITIVECCKCGCGSEPGKCENEK